MTEVETLREVTQRVTFNSWELLFSKGVDYMIACVINDGMSFGYDNPEKVSHMRVKFDGRDDLVNYGREQVLEMFQGKKSFAAVVKEIVECSACYRAQLKAEEESK